MSRRNKINMSDQEINDYLRAARTMILVSNGKDGYPHPMPMWFDIDDDNNIYMSTFRKSQKISNLRRDPRVSLLIESGDQYQELKSVVIYTEVEFLEDLDAVKDVMFRVSVQRGDADSNMEEQIKSGMQRSAEKRIGMRFRPGKLVTWDHGKLGGVY